MNKNLRAKIINLLFCNEQLSTSQMATLTGTNKSSVYTELRELRNCKIVQKSEGTRTYKLSPQLYSLICKSEADKISLKNGFIFSEIERSNMPLLYSMTLEENMEIAINSARGFCHAIPKRYPCAIALLCVLHHQSHMPRSTINDKLCFSASSPQLIAENLCQVFGDKSVLYINTENGMRVLSVNGVIAATDMGKTDKLISLLDSFFEFMTPEIVFSEGRFYQNEISSICIRHGIKYIKSNTVHGLFIDEAAAFKSALLNLSLH